MMNLSEAVVAIEQAIKELDAVAEKVKYDLGYGYDEDRWLIDDYKKAISDFEESEAWEVFDEQSRELWEKYSAEWERHWENAQKLRKEVEEFDYEEEARIQAGERRYEEMVGK